MTEDQRNARLDADPGRQQLEAMIHVLVERRRFASGSERTFIERQLNGLLASREEAVDFVNYYDPDFSGWRYY
jgi:hypothetical protein